MNKANKNLKQISLKAAFEVLQLCRLLQCYYFWYLVNSLLNP